MLNHLFDSQRDWSKIAYATLIQEIHLHTDLPMYSNILEKIKCSPALQSAIEFTNGLTDVLSFMEVAILLVYTFVTFYLWRESIRARAQTIMPVPYIRYYKPSYDDFFIVVENVGLGPMINSKIKDINVVFLDSGHKSTLSCESENDLIKVGESEKFRIKSSKRRVDILSLNPYISSKATIDVDFKDSTGRKYTAKFKKTSSVYTLEKGVKKRTWCVLSLRFMRDSISKFSAHIKQYFYSIKSKMSQILYRNRK